jgi:uncharacterized membrane protein YidH (DUF202 family)
MIAIKVLKIFGGIICIICAVLLFYFYHNYYEKHQYEPGTIPVISYAYGLCFGLLCFAILLLASAFKWL